MGKETELLYKARERLQKLENKLKKSRELIKMNEEDMDEYRKDSAIVIDELINTPDMSLGVGPIEGTNSIAGPRFIDLTHPRGRLRCIWLTGKDTQCTNMTLNRLYCHKHAKNKSAMEYMKAVEKSGGYVQGASEGSTLYKRKKANIMDIPNEDLIDL